jgi:hypothetical protein
MFLIIADNLIVHSFSLKLVILCKEPFLKQTWPFQENLFISIKDNVNQNMFEQKVFIKLNYIFCIFIIGQ